MDEKEKPKEGQYAKASAPVNEAEKNSPKGKTASKKSAPPFMQEMWLAS